MTPRIVILAACALLLLTTTSTTALARPGMPPNAQHPVQTHRAPSAVVRSYFAALDSRAPAGHDYQRLDRLYAPNIVLTENVTDGVPHSYVGGQQIRIFDGWNGLHWLVMRTERVTASTILTIERPSVKGPGHELGQVVQPWLTLFTVRNGKIVNIIWTAG